VVILESRLFSVFIDEKIICKYNNYYSRVFAEAYPGFSYFCLAGNNPENNNLKEQVVLQ
jgi:hypothetical protein